MRYVPLLLITTLLIGCTNSRWVIGPLYNRLDDRLESRFADLADFGDGQLEAAERLIDTFHVWHRQSELPRYARFLGELADALDTPGAVTQATASGWLETTRGFADRARQCYPTNFGASVVRTFSREQLADVRAAVAEEHAEEREEYRAQSAAERVTERVERFESVAARIGIDLDDDQRELVETLFTEQRSFGERWFELLDRWYDELFEILEAKADPALDRRLREHIVGRVGALQARYPEQWAHNRLLYERFVVDFAESLSPAQREDAVEWIRGMVDTLGIIAQAEPSFTPNGDPASGCRAGIDPQV